MAAYYSVLFFILLYSMILKADIYNKEATNTVSLMMSDPLNNVTCDSILNEFAEYAADFTKCSIMYARPVRLCEKCIDQYINFTKKYKDMLTAVENGKPCKSVYISQDRLDAVLEYHDNILSIWNKGNCHACYDWSQAVPVLSNETKYFITIFQETTSCIEENNKTCTNSSQVCANCMQDYLKLDNYYKTLSADAIGVDSICMDIVDSMNTTRSTWSKTLNCCKIRRTPEIIFLCCAGIISALPLFYYVVLRYCGPIRDFPNVLKQSRFKQTILRSLNGRIN
ncbi:osteopetrosis-associated transmembrane protein 1 [Anticarsia gemmatalis]|uniref:osteopetrosis-associated transmembrane protein 1 n=1 Tax=Anticarsia gemmatalis TaxID=129554 RepID=UPI003F759199